MLSYFLHPPLRALELFNPALIFTSSSSLRVASHSVSCLFTSPPHCPLVISFLSSSSCWNSSVFHAVPRFVFLLLCPRPEPAQTRLFVQLNPLIHFCQSAEHRYFPPVTTTKSSFFLTWSNLNSTFGFQILKFRGRSSSAETTPPPPQGFFPSLLVWT